ncbi:ABC transporter permease [Glaciihabitans sp. UYNi722]|uniref:ABC transporter permease n=1 Tax=Glaciihabitans sp. UYNi722 TaxID=3156344 RepID=UPI003391EB11
MIRTTATIDESTKTTNGRRAYLATLTSDLGPLIAALIAISIVLSFLTPSFLTASNLTNVIIQTSVIGIAAVGGTFVIITGGIDLSVGSVVALAGMIAAQVMTGKPVDAVAGGLIGIAVALAVGLIVGAVNGASVTWLRLVPFIVTLATLASVRGLTLAVSDGVTKYGFPKSFDFLGSGAIAGIRVPVFAMLLMFVLGHIVLRQTTFGHQVFAVGGNREAARLAGIPVKKVLFLVYVISGLSAAVAGVVLAGRLDSALPSAANGLELQVIAGIVVGGTSLAGGRGSIVGTLVGVLLIGVINNGLTLLGVNPFYTQFIQGVVIFAAVLLDALSQRRRRV